MRDIEEIRLIQAEIATAADRLETLAGGLGLPAMLGGRKCSGNERDGECKNWLDTSITRNPAGRLIAIADSRFQPELLRRARRLLRELDLYNIQFRPGDGWEGWRKYAPYDGIIVTAAAPETPGKLLQQLAVGGRMVIPVGPSGCQDLLLVTRRPDHFEEVSLGAVSFVPLVQGG